MSLNDRFRACMVLHGAGDAMGYKKGAWEFNTSGCRIYDELCQLGGVDALVLEPGMDPVLLDVLGR
jgi:hypothetical protein